jgi:RNA polymerase I-specific transcription initiation factor RRN7
MNLTYTFPIDKPRIRVIHHPEILLVCMLLVAAKHCFPFEGKSPISSNSDFRIPTLDWVKWHKNMENLWEGKPMEAEIDHRKLTAEQITKMPPADLSEYFAQLELLVDKKGALYVPPGLLAANGRADDDDVLMNFFPTEHQPQAPEPLAGTLWRKEESNRIMAESIEFADIGDGQQQSRSPRSAYSSYRTVEDLPPPGRVFYELAGKFTRHGPLIVHYPD